MTDPPCLAAALAYIADGLRVLALEPSIPGDETSGKAPIRPAGRPARLAVGEATNDPATARAWWAAHPQANVGIAVPGDWLVVDVDPRNGGAASYDALATEHGADAWPATREAATGGGGAHVIYQVPVGARFPGKLPGRKGLDVLGVGRYIVAAPSKHYSGGTYEWTSEGEPQPPPDWLGGLERGLATTSEAAAEDRDLTADEETSLDELAVALEPHFELGQRNPMAVAIGGLLRNAGLPPSAADYVIGQLPTSQPEKRLRDALGAWRAPVAAGASKLAEILTEAELAPILAVDLSRPWLRDARARREQHRAREAERAQKADVAHDVQPDDPGSAGDWFAKYGRRADRTALPPPIEYLVDGLPIAAGGKVNALDGAPNAGKSPFALLLALCVAGAVVKPELMFLGRPILKPGPTMYIDAETGVLAERRDARMCRGLGLDRSAVPLELLHFESVLSEEFCLGLEQELDRDPRALVVIDTYAACLAADIDHNSPQFAHWLRKLAVVSRGTGVPILVLMHEKKTAANGERAVGLQMIAGSVHAGGAVQSAIALYHESDESETVTVSCARAPEQKFKTFHVDWRDTEWRDSEAGVRERGEYLGLVAELVEPPPKPLTKTQQKEAEAEQDRAVARRQLFDHLRRGDSSLTGLRAAAPGKGHGLVTDILGELSGAGVVERYDVGALDSKGDVIYRYRLTPITPRVSEARLKLGLVE